MFYFRFFERPARPTQHIPAMNEKAAIGGANCQRSMGTLSLSSQHPPGHSGSGPVEFLAGAIVAVALLIADGVSGKNVD